MDDDSYIFFVHCLHECGSISDGCKITLLGPSSLQDAGSWQAYGFVADLITPFFSEFGIKKEDRKQEELLYDSTIPPVCQDIPQTPGKIVIPLPLKSEVSKGFVMSASITSRSITSMFLETYSYANSPFDFPGKNTMSDEPSFSLVSQPDMNQRHLYVNLACKLVNCFQNFEIPENIMDNDGMFVPYLSKRGAPESMQSMIHPILHSGLDSVSLGNRSASFCDIPSLEPLVQAMVSQKSFIPRNQRFSGHCFSFITN